MTKTKSIKITPLFLGQPTPEYSNFKPRTDEFLEELFENMEIDGIKIILLMGGWEETVFYPSKILKNPSKIDWYSKAFDLAEKHGMEVVLHGVPYKFNNLFTGKKWDPHEELEVSKKIYKELFELYASRKNFWGWYIPQEAGDRTHRGDIMILLRELPRFLKKMTPNKKVAYAPWFTSKITVGENDATTPAQCAENWDSMLAEIEGIDICCFQDTTAPEDEIREWFSAIAPIFKKHKIKLWSIAELFPRFQDRPGIDLFQSISFEHLMKKMEAAATFVESFGCWEYETHLNPKSFNPGAKELNKAYRLWSAGIKTR
jgi:hypothetical protein